MEPTFWGSVLRVFSQPHSKGAAAIQLSNTYPSVTEHIAPWAWYGTAGVTLKRVTSSVSALWRWSLLRGRWRCDSTWCGKVILWCLHEVSVIYRVLRWGREDKVKREMGQWKQAKNDVTAKSSLPGAGPSGVKRPWRQQPAKISQGQWTLPRMTLRRNVPWNAWS